MKQGLTQRPTSFFITAPLPCPYLEGKVERRMVTELLGRDATSLHDTLSKVGFRRSHGLVYAPICQDCSACLAVRTVVDEFTPSVSQRRVLRANDDVTVFEVKAMATSEQFELFSEYQDSRHAGGDMATMDFFDFQALIEETPVETFLQEFRTGFGDLIGACLIDSMGDGLSAVYSFFNPDLKRRSLGTFMILKLMETASARDLPYVYLGYWVNGSRKMVYKDKFRPLEYYDGKIWQSLEPLSD